MFSVSFLSSQLMVSGATTMGSMCETGSVVFNSGAVLDVDSTASVQLCGGYTPHPSLFGALFLPFCRAFVSFNVSV